MTNSSGSGGFQQRGGKFRTTRTLQRPGQPWRRALTQNLPLKLLALGVSVILFLMVREDKGRTVDMEIPVTVVGLDDNVILASQVPKSIRVRIKDRLSRITNALEHKSQPYEVDLRGVAPNSTYVFRPQRIRRILGVANLNIQTIQPSQLVVKLKPKFKKVVKVKPVLVGKPARGYMVLEDQVTVEPGTVEISGTKEAVSKVHKLPTYPVDVSGLRDSVRHDVRIQSPDVPYLKLAVQKVTVHVPIKPRSGKLTLKDVPVAMSGCPQTMTCKLSPDSVRVFLSGPEPELIRIQENPSLLKVYLTLDGVSIDQKHVRRVGLRIRCDVPAGVDCRTRPIRSAVTLAPLAVHKEEDRRPRKEEK